MELKKLFDDLKERIAKNKNKLFECPLCGWRSQKNGICDPCFYDQGTEVDMVEVGLEEIPHRMTDEEKTFEILVNSITLLSTDDLMLVRNHVDNVLRLR